MRLDDSRRQFVRRLGAVALVGSLAGCGGDDGTPTETATETEDQEPVSPSPPPGTTTAPGNTTTTAPATTTTMGTPTDTPTPTPIPGPDEYLSNTPNYDGTIVDETGSGSVTVGVGADGQLIFEPAAIRISTGTTVTWEWQGGVHNVVAEDGTFDSGAAVGDPNTTFEHTFDSAGEWAYFCEPHVFAGMKGYVIVE